MVDLERLLSWRPVSLRTRMVLIAAAATAVVLVVGGAALALSLRAVMIDDAMVRLRTTLNREDLGGVVDFRMKREIPAWERRVV